MQLVSLALKGGLGRDCGAARLISVEGGVWVETVVQLDSLALKGGSGSRLWCS